MNILVGIVIFIAGFSLLYFVSELHIALRKRMNTPLIGIDVLLKLLKKYDYVCIDGKVSQFSHIAHANEPLNILTIPSESNKTIGGELAFMNNYGLGYVYCFPSIMVKCDFIFGKYGLKWARNRVIANSAKEKIQKYHYE